MGGLVMFSRRTVLDLLAFCAFASVENAEPAKKQESAKKHQHKNGHNLLGAKLRQNGRHQIDRAGQATVSADVSNGKVTAMSANHPQKGNLPARKVKSRQNMAGIEPQLVRVAADTEGAQLAQVIVYTSYGWCFDDGLDVYCYWYPADVVIVDTSWVEFVP